MRCKNSRRFACMCVYVHVLYSVLPLCVRSIYLPGIPNTLPLPLSLSFSLSKRFKLLSGFGPNRLKPQYLLFATSFIFRTEFLQCIRCFLFFSSFCLVALNIHTVCQEEGKKILPLSHISTSTDDRVSYY